jgi:DNA repair protein RadC
MKRSFTVRDLPKPERPRERLLKFGPEVLSTQEILALVLSRGVSGESVLSIAQRLLSRFQNLPGIGQASIEELKTIKGIGNAKACQLKAALELARRLESYPDSEPATITTARDVAAVVKAQLKGKKREHFLAVLLNSRNQVIRTAEISSGSLNATVVHPREVFEEALAAHAASVIFVHNHPSGDTDASDDDIKLTRRLVEAGKIMGVEVLDHIIVSDRSEASMKSRGLM